MILAARGGLAAAVGVVLLAATACAAKNSEPAAGAPCPAENQRYCTAAVGDLLDVTLGDLRPTQPSLGYDEVYYRLGRYTLGAKPVQMKLDGLTHRALYRVACGTRRHTARNVRRVRRES
jgi:hypothetical protein